MLNPMHLSTLGAVLEHGSFVTAANHLGYTPSAVSQQMGALEHSTGLVLFERLPRSVRPTRAAEYLAKGGRDIVSALRSLELDAHALAAAALGELRLGSFRTASARILPGVLHQFCAEHPAVDVHLDEAEPEELVPALLDGTLDLALAYQNDLDPRDWPKNLTRLHLLTEQRHLLLPPGFRKAGQPVKLSSLRHETWIASKPSPSFLRLCADVGFEPNVTLRTNDYYSICEFVKAGLGIALVPELGFFLRDQLTPYELSPPAPKRHVFALYRSSNSNPLITPMINTLRAATTAMFPAVETADVGRSSA